MSSKVSIDPRVERTRKAVLDATVDLLATDGGGVTIDGIAERSGVARSTIYRHWPDRADLFADAFGVVCAVGEIADVGSFVAELRQRAEVLAHGLSREPWGQILPTIVGGADHDPDLRSALDAFTGIRRDEALEVAQRAVERGEIGPDQDIGPSLERFIAPFFFRRMMTGDDLDDDFIEAQLAWVCGQLGARYSPPE